MEHIVPVFQCRYTGRWLSTLPVLKARGDLGNNDIAVAEVRIALDNISKAVSSNPDLCHRIRGRLHGNRPQVQDPFAYLTLSDARCSVDDKTKPLHLPMRRDLAQPLDAGVLVLRVRAEAPRPRLLYPFGPQSLSFAFSPSLNPRPPGSSNGPGLGERTLLDQTVADRPKEAPHFLACIMRTAPPGPGRPATSHGRPRPRARSRRRSPYARAGRREAPPAPRPCRPAAGSGSSPRLCGPDS